MNEFIDYAGADGLKMIDGIRIFIELLIHMPDEHFTNEYNLRVMDDKTINPYYIYGR